MRRAPAALALALVLSGLRTVGAEPCPPRAELAGDGGAVARVAEELRRLGVLVTNHPNEPSAGAVRRDGCVTVHAQVALDDGGGISVAVRGAAQGSEGRVVSDAALAAAWIDSWTREDVDLALWAAPAAPPRFAPPSAERPRAEPNTTTRAPRISMAAGYEQTWSDDGVTWRGASVAACVRVGAFCLGGRARLGFDAARSVNSTAVARDDLAVLATGSYPITVGAMVIAPELGVGLGRLVTKRADGGCAPAPPPNCDPMDPTCVMPPTPCDPTNPGDPGMSSQVLVGDGFRATSYTPRISLALRIAVPLFESVWLDGLAGLSLSPLGHVTSYEPQMSPVTAIVPAAQLALPGEPERGYQLGIGLRVAR